MQILIRRAEPDDCDALREIYAQSPTIMNTLQLPYPSRATWRKRLTPEPGVHRLVACADGRVVGEICLWTRLESAARRHAGTIGLAVHEDWYRQGVGRALMSAAIALADDWLDLHRLELEVYTDNAPAIALYEAFGFVREGTRRAYAFRNGRYVDAHGMARLRPA